MKLDEHDALKKDGTLLTGTLLIFGSPVRSRESDSIIRVVPFQPEIYCDSECIQLSPTQSLKLILSGQNNSTSLYLCVLAELLKALTH